MKKGVLFFMSSVIMVLSIHSVSAAEISSFLLDASNKTPKVNENFYISIFATDTDGLQINTLDPKFIVTPAKGIKITKFVNCASAEGREVCKQYDPTFAGMDGGYVAKVVSTSSGSFDLMVFSDSNRVKSASMEINIGDVANKVVSNEQGVITLDNSPVTGSHVQGVLYLFLGLFLIVFVLVYGIIEKRKEYIKNIK